MHASRVESRMSVSYEDVGSALRGDCDTDCVDMEDWSPSSGQKMPLAGVYMPSDKCTKTKLSDNRSQNSSSYLQSVELCQEASLEQPTVRPTYFRS